ncbi:MAG: MotA/TolQ/ExbB proton channel family protein [Planctomycetota bacterium]
MMLLIAEEPQTLVGAFVQLWTNAWDIWTRGGWAMALIALNAAILFGFAMHVLLKILGKRHTSVSEKTWRMWIDHAKYREGKVGRLLDTVTRAESLEELGSTFEGIRHLELRPIQRDVKIMSVCIASAPLLGLLGTVTGMLATFAALAEGQGGDKTMAAVSLGISEALITTMTGLVVALPGMFTMYFLNRMRDRYAAFLQKIETTCAQSLYHQLLEARHAA